MKKRAISLAVVLCMVLTLLPTAVQAADPSGNWVDKVTTQPAGYKIVDSNNIEISSAEGLAWMVSVVNGRSGLVSNNLTGKTITLTASIDLSAHYWTPIGLGSNAFAGTFDGNGHSIGGMTVTGTLYVGLFGHSKGIVENLSVSGSVSANNAETYVGGIVGLNYGGTVKNCNSTCDVTATGTTDKEIFTGGIVGRNYNGTVENCHNTGRVEATGEKYIRAGGIAGGNSDTITGCFNTGPVTASGSQNNYAGGIAGNNTGNSTVTNCFNTGAVSAENGDSVNGAGGLVGDNNSTGSKLTNCFNTGATKASGGGSSFVGGLAGRNDNGTIENCYWLVGTANHGAPNNKHTNSSSFTEGQGKGTDATFSYKLGSTSYADKTLCDALNAWVQVQAAPNEFFGWANLSDAVYPTLHPANILHKVSFDVKGGSTVSPGSKTVARGGEYGTLPETSRTGYSFSGWYTATNGGSKITSSTAVNLAADQTLYAQWIPNTNTGYKVEHYQQNVAGDEYILKETTISTGITDTAVTAVANNYAGFAENETHSNRKPSGIIAADGGLVLKLYYDRNLYTVTFESNGGSGVAALCALYETTIAKPDDPTRAGYTFTGWYKNEGFTETWDFATDPVTSGTTLYAKWTAKTDTLYKVEHYQQNVAGDGYDKKDTDNLSGTTGETATAAAQTYTGFTEAMSHPGREQNGIIAGDGTLVLKLYYERNSYTVTFESNSGSAVAGLTVLHEATIAEPGDPTRSRHTFVGWYKEEGLTTAWDFATDTVTSDTTLYAKWKARPVSGSEITSTTSPSGPGQANPPATGIINPTATIGANGQVNATASERDVNNAINAALDLANRDGSTSNGIAVSIDLSSLQDPFITLPLALSEGILQALVDAEVKLLEIKTPQITLSLDLQALDAILQNMDNDVIITVQQIDPSTLSAAARAAIGDRPVYMLTVTSGGKKITNFDGGWISVALPYIPADGENPSGLCAVYIDGEGGAEWLWNSGYSRAAGALLFSTEHFSIFGIGYREPPEFADIGTHWAKEDIEYAAVRSLFSGTADNMFSPDLAMSRAMLVTVLWRMEGSPALNRASDFSDVAGSMYYAEAVAWAASNGIVSGYGSGLFGPDDSITREQIAAILHRYAQYKRYDASAGADTNILSYTDAFDISEYAIPAVQWACGAGLLQGSNGNLMPLENATRAQVAAILHRFSPGRGLL